MNRAEILTVGANDFGIIDYSGIEGADYKISSAERIRGVGSRYTKTRIPQRDITVTAEYKKRAGKSEMRLFLVSFFRPDEEGVLSVESAGTRRQIPYRVEGFTYKQTNIHEKLQFLAELYLSGSFFPVYHPHRSIDHDAGGRLEVAIYAAIQTATVR
ncbi:MAG: hypothetical protein V8S96_03625 [Lachnospiraceae bacterium]